MAGLIRVAIPVDVAREIAAAEVEAAGLQPAFGRIQARDGGRGPALRGTVVPAGKTRLSVRVHAGAYARVLGRFRVLVDATSAAREAVSAGCDVFVTGTTGPVVGMTAFVDVVHAPDCACRR